MKTLIKILVALSTIFVLPKVSDAQNNTEIGVQYLGTLNNVVVNRNVFRSDSAIEFPLTDTSKHPSRPGRLTSFNGSPYWWNGVFWYKLNGDTSSLPGQVNADWTATSGVALILHKPTFATVATTGSYTDLTSKPTIPAAQVNSDWSASSGLSQILNKPRMVDSIWRVIGKDSIYFRVIESDGTVVTKQILDSLGTGGGSSGTVTVVTSGNLAPLFGVTVNTNTTTPAFVFTLSNAAAHKWLGNPSGSTTAPAYNSLTVGDLPTSIPLTNILYAVSQGIIQTGDTLKVDTIGTIATLYDVSLKQNQLNGTGYIKQTGTSSAFLTPTQVTADLNIFTTTLKGLVPAPTAINGYVLSDNGTWVPQSGGGGIDTVHTKRGVWNTGGNTLVLGGPVGGTWDSSVYFGIGNTVATLKNRFTFDSVGAGWIINGVPSSGTHIALFVHNTDSSFSEVGLGTNLSFSGGLINATGGGSGSTNTSVGTLFPLAITGTNNVKTLGSTDASLSLDTLVANQVNIKLNLAHANTFTAAQTVNAAFATNNTVKFTGLTAVVPTAKDKVAIIDTTTGQVFTVNYYPTDTTGYSAGNTYFTFNGSKIVLSGNPNVWTLTNHTISPVSNSDSVTVGTATATAPLTVVGQAKFSQTNSTASLSGSLTGTIVTMTQNAVANGIPLTMVGNQINITANAGDTLNAANFYQAGLNNPSGYISAVTVYGMAGGSLAHIGTLYEHAAPDATAANFTYGYQSGIMAGTGKYQAYMQGTAPSYLNGQVLLGATSASASAQLYMNSTTQGFRPPSMITSQQNAIGSPVAGLLIYNTDSLAYTYYNGTAWLKIGTGSGGGSTHYYQNMSLTADSTGVIFTRGDGSADTLITNSSSGTVTNVTSGNLSPLFTASFSNPTSTPTLGFTLSAAPAHSYFGNNTGSSVNPAYITNTQITADLNQFTTSLQGLAPASGGGTTNFLRADGTWTAPPATTVTIGAFSNTAVANGATASGAAVTLTAADATHPGEITSGTQNIGGIKTLTSGVLNIGNTYTSDGASLFFGANTTSSPITGSNFSQGTMISIASGTTNLDNNTAGSAAEPSTIFIGAQTFNATNAQTYSTPSTVYIAGAPTMGTNVTSSSPYALYVNTGNSLFGGNIYQTLTSGFIQAIHLNYQSAINPTFSAGAAAGTAPSISGSVGADQTGIISLTTGVSTTTGTLLTVTYAESFPNGSYAILMPANALTALLTGVNQVYVTGSATNFVIHTGTTALTAISNYQWYYYVGGR